MVCEDHENKEIIGYCKHHNEFLCSTCLFDHIEHAELVKEKTFKQFFIQI